MELEYYNQYIEYVEYYRHTVAIIIRRRRIAVAIVTMYLLKIYMYIHKKKFWIASIFENCNKHSFFFAWFRN